MEQALEALILNCGGHTEGKAKDSIAALKTALAEQSQQEPVATKTDGGITLHVGWDDVPVGAKLYAALQPVTAGEPVYWEYKHVDDDPDDWQRVVPRTMQTLEVALAEIQGYRMGKKKLYEVRALYTAPQPVIPPGYKLVPVEPTEAMLGAGLRHIDGMASMPSAYRAMLNAAPTPPAPAVEGETK